VPGHTRQPRSHIPNYRFSKRPPATPRPQRVPPFSSQSSGSRRSAQCAAPPGQRSGQFHRNTLGAWLPRRHGKRPPSENPPPVSKHGRIVHLRAKLPHQPHASRQRSASGGAYRHHPGYRHAPASRDAPFPPPQPRGSTHRSPDLHSPNHHKKQELVEFFSHYGAACIPPTVGPPARTP